LFQARSNQQAALNIKICLIQSGPLRVDTKPQPVSPRLREVCPIIKQANSAGKGEYYDQPEKYLGNPINRI